MKKLLFLVLFPSIVCAQQYRNSVIVDPRFGLINEVIPKPKVTGSIYLFDEWEIANIYLHDKAKVADANVFEDLTILFDISRHWFEIKTGNDIKVLDGKKVKFFEVFRNGKRSQFINKDELKNLDKMAPCFFEILVDGDYKILSRVELQYIKANYNAALDVGERNDKFIQSRTLYLYNGSAAKKLEPGKKKFLDLIPTKKQVLEEYAKKEKLGFKKEADLIQLIKYYNTI